MKKLYYNNSLIYNVSDNTPPKDIKRMIQRHLNQSKKYSYVVSDYDAKDDGKISIKALVRGDSNIKPEELIIKSYSIK